MSATPDNQAEHNRQTRDAYDRLAAVWAVTTDEGEPSDDRGSQAPLPGPRPAAEAPERYPDDLAQLVGVPIFIVYRLRLAG